MSVTTDDDEGHALKDFLRTTGTKIIQQQIQKYIDDLKQGGLICTRMSEDTSL